MQSHKYEYPRHYIHDQLVVFALSHREECDLQNSQSARDLPHYPHQSRHHLWYNFRGLDRFSDSVRLPWREVT